MTSPIPIAEDAWLRMCWIRGKQRGDWIPAWVAVTVRHRHLFGPRDLAGSFVAWTKNQHRLSIRCPVCDGRCVLPCRCGDGPQVFQLDAHCVRLDVAHRSASRTGVSLAHFPVRRIFLPRGVHSSAESCAFGCWKRVQRGTQLGNQETIEGAETISGAQGRWPWIWDAK